MNSSLLSIAAAAAASLLTFSGAWSTAHAQTVGFAPDINNGSAYNNNAILGFTPDRSYIRFANMRDETESVRNYVEVYSLDSQRVVGRFELDVRPKASRQLSYRSIIGLAGLRYEDAATQDLVLYVQNGRGKQLWQHVHYDLNTQKLENATVCSTAPHVDYIASHNVVMNAHTSTMKFQTSLITIHNFADTDSTFQANIYDGSSGDAIGFVPIKLKARESFNESVAWFEEQMGHKPTSAQFHYNIELVPTSFPHGKAVIGHAVANTNTGEGANLSNPCALHGEIISIDFPT